MSGKDRKVEQASRSTGGLDRQSSAEGKRPRKKTDRASEDPQELSPSDEDRKEAAADRDPAEGKP